MFRLVPETRIYLVQISIETKFGMVISMKIISLNIQAFKDLFNEINIHVERNMGVISNVNMASKNP